jgi:predicted RND superfamily exporter protein
LFDRAEQRARGLGWPDAAATGPAVQVARDSTALAKGQLGGMLFTAVALWLTMVIGLGSGVLGLIGMVPNLVPCVILYGGLALADRPLSVGTALIGSVMLGLIVDDTIHLLHGFRRGRLQGCGALSTMARMLGRIGRAITLTSLVLATGFATGSFGSLATTREFGILSAGTILTALAADVVLLPSLLWLCNRWTAS